MPCSGILGSIRLGRLKAPTPPSILRNYYFELYGTPNNISQNNDNFFIIWYLNNSMIMLEIFFPKNDSLYAQYRYVDTISVFHSYRNN